MGEIEFLRRIYQLEQMPSTDARFTNALEDIWQHRVRNEDWEANWVFFDERFALLNDEDAVFLRFLSEMLHPLVRKDPQEVETLAQAINELLRVDGYELVKVTEVSGRPVFGARCTPSASPPAAVPPMQIPARVVSVVGDALGSWYCSHGKLDALFRESEAPGDPPPGNCIKKCQDWLKRVNEAADTDPIGCLGKVLVDFMSLEPHADPKWQQGAERIKKALGENGLAWSPAGRIVVMTAQKRFRVALSFPGERRPFVEQVATHLTGCVDQGRVLYDKYFEAEFARPDLDTYLPNLYRTESELIVIFLCADYAKKRWCRLEWRFIRQLICTSDAHRIMFLSFDDIGAVPEIGILSGDGYVSIGARTPEVIASLILERLRVNTGQSSDALAPAVQSGGGAPQVTRATPRTVASGMNPSPAAGQPTPTTVLQSLAVWQEKLAFLLVEEGKTVDADQKFRLSKLIEEARGKIREQGGQP